MYDNHSSKILRKYDRNYKIYIWYCKMQIMQIVILLFIFLKCINKIILLIINFSILKVVLKIMQIVKMTLYGNKNIIL